MKSKISLTIEDSLLDKLDIAMKKHNQQNRSKFVEFIFREILYNKETQYKLLIRQRDDFLRQFKTLNEEILVLEEALPKVEEEESETLESPIKAKSLMTERAW